MPIDSKLSDQFRMLLSYCMKNQVEKFTAGIAEVGYAPYESMLALAIRVTGHVVVETAERYPNDADLEEISAHAAKAVTGLPVDQGEIHAYLSRVVFGSDRVTGISEDHVKASVIPMLALANIMVCFVPKGLTPWTWLDVIEASIDAVENTNEPVLPSMVYEFCRPKR